MCLLRRFVLRSPSGAHSYQANTESSGVAGEGGGANAAAAPDGGWSARDGKMNILNEKNAFLRSTNFNSLNQLKEFSMSNCDMLNS